MVTASIVLFHTPLEQLKRAINSFRPAMDKPLFLIDNGLDPLSESTLHEIGCDGMSVQYEHTGKNLGYGRAHNIGLKKSIAIGADYHIILNPDVAFDPSVVDQLVAYADAHSDVVYVLPRVVYPDGSLQYLCHLLPTPMDLLGRRFLPKTKRAKQRNERYELRMFSYDLILNPPCLSGCFMFLRVKTIAEHDLFFDERYFMYCEDYDLIRRLHRVGKTLFYPFCTIVHDHARESYKNKKLLMAHIRSAIIYFNTYGWFFDRERKRENQKVLAEIKALEGR